MPKTPILPENAIKTPILPENLALKCQKSRKIAKKTPILPENAIKTPILTENFAISTFYFYFTWLWGEILTILEL